MDESQERSGAPRGPTRKGTCPAWRRRRRGAGYRNRPAGIRRRQSHPTTAFVLRPAPERISPLETFRSPWIKLPGCSARARHRSRRNGSAYASGRARTPPREPSARSAFRRGAADDCIPDPGDRLRCRPRRAARTHVRRPAPCLSFARSGSCYCRGPHDRYCLPAGAQLAIPSATIEASGSGGAEVSIRLAQTGSRTTSGIMRVPARCVYFS
jgi:hypothetical protein